MLKNVDSSDKLHSPIGHDCDMGRVCVLATLLYLVLAELPSSTNSKEYRSDYEYNDKKDAFYKLHIESASLIDAKRICEVEGAALMVPASHQDIVQIHRMFKLFPDIGDYAWVAEDGQDHESAEEPTIIELDTHREDVTPVWNRQCDVVSRQGDVKSAACYQSLPFICKVDAADAFHNSECSVYGKDYQRAQNVSSCYKIPPIAYTWNQAYAQCAAEGAHLVVVNSQVEHDVIHYLMNSNPAVSGTEASWFFYAGFRAQPTTDGTPKVFKTIFNETLLEAGYSTWADNEPNNALNEENCGTLFKNDGKLNDVDCTHLYAFICEKEINRV